MKKAKTAKISMRKDEDVTEQVTLSKDDYSLLQIFIEQHPPQRLAKNLRKMMLHFLMSEGGMEETYLDDLLYDLDALFNIIDELPFKAE